MKSRLTQNILIAVVFVGVIVVNYLANALPIGGITTGEASDLYPNLFTPAGLTFSIWGIIYLLLLMYVIYSFVRKVDQDDNHNNSLELIKRDFTVNCLANMGWILAWHHGLIFLSVLIMLILLFTLIRIADRVNVDGFSFYDKIFIKLPFSVYFGWITVATIANITALLVSWDWNGFGIDESYWTIFILIVGLVIGMMRTIKDYNIFYAFVLVWAYGGIWLKHTSDNGFMGEYPAIISTLIFCIVLFGISIGYVTFSRLTVKSD